MKTKYAENNRVGGAFKRLWFILVFVFTVPLVILAAFISALPMPLIALVIYIIHGDENDELMDFIQYPFVWAMDLPYKLTGQD